MSFKTFNLAVDQNAKVRDSSTYNLWEKISSYLRGCLLDKAQYDNSTPLIPIFTFHTYFLKILRDPYIRL